MDWLTHYWYAPLEGAHAQGVAAIFVLFGALIFVAVMLAIRAIVALIAIWIGTKFGVWVAKGVVKEWNK